jgi:dihydrolipoamide dehydrogenase
MEYQYDLIVIGAGPGGYVSAIYASQLGMKTVIIEKDKPGGVCLNIGCIPSKSLIHQADIFSNIKSLKAMGVEVNVDNFDYKKVFMKSRNAAETLSKGAQFLLKKNKVEYIQDEAFINGEHQVKLKSGKEISGKNIIIATGSRPTVIPGFEPDEKTILTSNGALMLEKLPKSIVILGSGAIGIELAYVFNAFGVEIEIIEMLDQLLPLEDAEIVSVLERAFKKRGIKYHTSSKATSVKKKENGVEIVFSDPDGQEQTAKAEKMILAIGRTPNTENLGIDKLGIETIKRFISVGDYYQTKIPSIYAIGDVVNSPALAHVASHEGEIAVKHMNNIESHKKIDENAIPNAVYCEPQIASFGLRENQTKENNLDVKISKFPIRGAGKSVAIEKSEGMVKIICDKKTEEILGAHIVGAEATELIHEILLAKSAELLGQDIAQTIHAHPTIAEAVMEAARGTFTKQIHA